MMTDPQAGRPITSSRRTRSRCRRCSRQSLIQAPLDDDARPRAGRRTCHRAAAAARGLRQEFTALTPKGHETFIFCAARIKDSLLHQVLLAFRTHFGTQVGMTSAICRSPTRDGRGWRPRRGSSHAQQRGACISFDQREQCYRAIRVVHPGAYAGGSGSCWMRIAAYRGRRPQGR
jgi:hypothetical protein